MSGKFFIQLVSGNLVDNDSAHLNGTLMTNHAYGLGSTKETHINEKVLILMKIHFCSGKKKKNSSYKKNTSDSIAWPLTLRRLIYVYIGINLFQTQICKI